MKAIKTVSLYLFLWFISHNCFSQAHTIEKKLDKWDTDHDVLYPDFEYSVYKQVYGLDFKKLSDEKLIEQGLTYLINKCKLNFDSISPKSINTSLGNIYNKFSSINSDYLILNQSTTSLLPIMKLDIVYFDSSRPIDKELISNVRNSVTSDNLDLKLLKKIESLNLTYDFEILMFYGLELIKAKKIDPYLELLEIMYSKLQDEEKYNDESIVFYYMALAKYYNTAGVKYVEMAFNCLENARALALSNDLHEEYLLANAALILLLLEIPGDASSHALAYRISRMYLIDPHEYSERQLAEYYDISLRIRMKYIEDEWYIRHQRHFRHSSVYILKLLVLDKLSFKKANKVPKGDLYYYLSWSLMYHYDYNNGFDYIKTCLNEYKNDYPYPFTQEFERAYRLFLKCLIHVCGPKATEEHLNLNSYFLSYSFDYAMELEYNLLPYSQVKEIIKYLPSSKLVNENLFYNPLYILLSKYKGKLFHMGMKALKSGDSASAIKCFLKADSLWNIQDVIPFYASGDQQATIYARLILKSERKTKMLLWWVIGALGMVLISLFVILFFYKKSIKQKKALAKKEIEQRILSRTMYQIGHMAPECINNLLRHKDKLTTELLDSYLSKLSIHLRKFYDYSMKDFIEYQDEYDLICDYVDLTYFNYSRNGESQPSDYINANFKQFASAQMPTFVAFNCIQNAFKHGQLGNISDAKDLLTVSLTKKAENWHMNIVNKIRQNNFNSSDEDQAGTGISFLNDVLTIWNSSKKIRPPFVGIKQVDDRFELEYIFIDKNL